MKPDAQPQNYSPGRLDTDPREEILEQIASAIRGVRFGSIEVVIQDSRVVQIERKEKFRLDKSARGIARA